MGVKRQLRQKLTVLGVTGLMTLGFSLLSGAALADQAPASDGSSNVTSPSQSVSQSSNTVIVSDGAQPSDQSSTSGASTDSGAPSSTQPTSTSSQASTGGDTASSTQPAVTSSNATPQADPSAATASPSSSVVSTGAAPVATHKAQAVATYASIVTQAVITSAQAAVGTVVTPAVVAAAQAATHAATLPLPSPLRGPVDDVFGAILSVLTSPLVGDFGGGVLASAPALALVAAWFVLSGVLIGQTNNFNRTYAGLLRRGGFATAARSDAGARPMISLLVGYTPIASRSHVGGPFLVGSPTFCSMFPTLMKGGR